MAANNTGAATFRSKIKEFTLRNCNGIEVGLLNYGAAITSVRTPDRNGHFDDITLGFKQIEDYEQNPPYFGSTIGRVANRIANGKFSIDGEDFNLDCNEKGINHLHGGLVGFDKHFWNATQDDNKQYVCFNLESPDGDQGYPGELDATVCYTLNADNELKITYKAVVKDRPTIVNLMCHPYFNLSGTEKKCGKVDDHLLEINANCYLPMDENQIPTGERRCVSEDNGIFDFRKPKLIGKDIEKLPGSGYDHSFCKFPKQNFCLRASHPESGRVLEVYSSQPAIHIYTPNYTCNSLLGKHGDFYKGRCGFAIENQNFPNSINLHFPPCPILRPGDLYEQITTMKFSVQ